MIFKIFLTIEFIALLLLVGTWLWYKSHWYNVQYPDIFVTTYTVKTWVDKRTKLLLYLSLLLSVAGILLLIWLGF